MASVLLLAGPAGADKSQAARDLMADYPGLIVAADFQAIYSALDAGRT